MMLRFFNMIFGFHGIPCVEEPLVRTVLLPLVNISSLIHSSCHNSSRPPLDKLLQILHGCHAQHKSSVLVGNDGKLLLPRATLGLTAAEEVLELLKGGVHGDDSIGAAAALEAGHGGGELVLRGDLAGLEEGVQVGDGDVAEEGAGLGVDDGEVGVFALIGGDEGEGDCVGGVEGEGGGRVEVLDGGLRERVYVRFCRRRAAARGKK
jgi:hypothetical protein